MTMDENEQIRELYRNYWRYMIDKNADGLRGLMARDYSNFAVGRIATKSAISIMK